jgi:hypothetical protein
MMKLLKSDARFSTSSLGELMRRESAPDLAEELGWVIRQEIYADEEPPMRKACTDRAEAPIDCRRFARLPGGCKPLRRLRYPKPGDADYKPSCDAPFTRNNSPLRMYFRSVVTLR